MYDMMKKQNFGVEIELTGITRENAAKTIANYFGTRSLYIGGSYRTYSAQDRKGRMWKAMSDSSIATFRKVRGNLERTYSNEYACEVVTPVLQYEDLDDLQNVIRALRKAGAIANDSCGIHVHVDGANHTPASLTRLMNFAIGRQDLFYEALQIGNLASHWCKKMNCSLFKAMKHDDAKSRDSLEHIWYSAVNDGYDDGVHFCPRCGRFSVKDRLHTNALSRYIDVYICDECGLDEAVRAMADEPLPLREWAVAKEQPKGGIL